MKKTQKIMVAIGAVMALCLMVAGVFTMTANSTEKRLAEQLELGQRYLDELDYEQAIAAYKAAIEIDPKCEEAYHALAEAYIGLGDYDSVVAILKEGYAQTGSAEMEERLKELYSVMLEAVSKEPVKEEVTKEELVSEEEEELAGEGTTGIPPVPETDEWAASLYEALLADDYQTVMELASNPETVQEHCELYEDADWAYWDYETAYRLKMSDGQVMGIILYEFEDGYWEIDSFVSYKEGDGFEYTGYGDHQVTLFDDGSYMYLRNGNEIVSHTKYNAGGFLESEDGIFSVWHM